VEAVVLRRVAVVAVPAGISARALDLLRRRARVAMRPRVAEVGAQAVARGLDQARRAEASHAAVGVDPAVASRLALVRRGARLRRAAFAGRRARAPRVVDAVIVRTDAVAASRRADDRPEATPAGASRTLNVLSAVARDGAGRGVRRARGQIA